MRKYPHLSAPITVRGIPFKNRILATPIQSSGTTCNGVPTEKACYFFGERAKGGAAVVTMGEAAVNNDYAIRLGQTTDLTRFDFDKVDDFHRYTYAIKRYGSIPSIQLCHAGTEANPRDAQGNPLLPIGPSPRVRPAMDRPSRTPNPNPQMITTLEMTKEQIRQTIADFANCAANAKQYGFEMVQLHGGHGWLLDQFSSKLLNQRTDEYGGSVENRARFACELLDAVRAAVGSDFLIEYRLSWDQMLDGGNTLEDTIEFAKQIQDKVDIINVSIGTHWVLDHCNRIFPLWFVQHGLNIEAAGEIKKNVSCLVSVVGGIDDPAMAETALAEGKCDFISMCRGLIADPHWPNKAIEGRDDEIIPCVRCITCHDNMAADGTFCATNPKTLQEYWLKDTPPVSQPRRVVVIGGGVGGMQAAITARQRGHEVILLEKENELGGILKFTNFPTAKKDMNAFVRYQIHMCEKLGVDVRLNTEATPELVDSLDPHTVIAAVGSEPVRPRIPGIEHGVTALWAYAHQEQVGQNVAIIGGNLSGLELGIDLASAGHNVTVVEMLDEVGAGAPTFYWYGVKEELERNAERMTLKTGAACTAITPEGITVQTKDGEQTIPADTVVYAVGMRSRSDVADQFAGCGLHFAKIGDCQKVARMKQTVTAGYHAALNIM
jgi:2,4-dienoyl-CoA reductase-like NADH-dependent reductase (Old Yellow Enzyme family)/thioredoxin reductase